MSFLASRLEGRMESSGVTCPDMESLVEDTESLVGCVPLLATSLMDLSGEKSEGGLCTGRRRFVPFKVFSGYYNICESRPWDLWYTGDLAKSLIFICP